MLDTRYNSVVYQSQVYVSALVDRLIVSKKTLGKEKDKLWAKVDKIYAYLEALQETSKLTDPTEITDVTFILECLIVLCEISSFPVVPSLMWIGVPNLIVGAKGDKGDKGDTGNTGATGLATDFSYISTSITVIVDSFPITNAKAARWDYVVTEAGGALRASSIIGEWTSDGTSHDLADLGANDLVSATSGIEFDISISGSTVQLIAVITSGVWSIWGSRYFIPNNGNGSGPITNVLPLGQVYIGNSSNQAQAQSVSGVITITPSGVTSYTAGSVTNTTISSSANIALTKLATLNPSIIPITDGSGFLTSSTLSPTTLGYVDIGSSLVGLLNAKLTDPLTTIGDLLIKDASNLTTRLPIGSVNQVLTVIGGVPTWQNLPGGISGLTTGFLPKASSPSTITDSIISETTGAILIAGTLEAQGGIRKESGEYTKSKILPIGDWNMNLTSSVSIAHGLSDFTKIRTTSIVIFSDTGSLSLDLVSGANDNGNKEGYFYRTSSDIILFRRTGGYFNSTAFDATSYNRGYITIEYEV